MIVCEECGSTEIQTQAWVDANTHQYIGETGIDRDDNWCNEWWKAKSYDEKRAIFKEHNSDE